jgi:hypothetical protein
MGHATFDSTYYYVSVSDIPGRHRFPTQRRGAIDYRQPT